ncbi:hypothetical protein KI387_038745 [Taxus chinensis]|uniref:Uncharacterized protein n=1 Tax=Taxus chinensis TaxID=29808 RepID=A0AA38C6X1_TAXCH|nr:hypothetical protein KI387_038745 [Taxus chinensis]
MDLKTKKFSTSRDVEFCEKKEQETPPQDLPDVDFLPIVKTKVDVPIDDETDDGDDGDDQIEPRPMGAVECIPKWYTSMLRDKK